MVGVWVVVFLFTFIIVSKYLCKKWHQDFYKLFYWLPIAILFIYFFGAYTQFVLDYWLIPRSLQEIKILFSPYWYNFNFIGLLIWFVISLFLFFKKIQRYETKRIRIDIIFFSLVLSFIPFWIFLIFGDNFIWKPSNSIFTLKPLTIDSELNKFNWVYPIWLFLSIWASIVIVISHFLKKKRKQFWEWIIWFILFLLGINVIFLFQQYPRYGVISFVGITFDIKHYISFFVMMYWLHIYYKWKSKTPDNTNV